MQDVTNSKIESKVEVEVKSTEEIEYIEIKEDVLSTNVKITDEVQKKAEESTGIKEDTHIKIE